VEMAWCVRAYLPSTKHDTDNVTGFCVVPTLKVFPLFSPCCCVFTFLFFFFDGFLIGDRVTNMTWMY
jgi:hypothetical protein